MEGADKEARLWGMFCHLSALVLCLGIPFGHIVGPLIIWLIKKDEIPFVNDQGKESLNFQISMTIYGFVAAIFIFLLIGIPLLVALFVANLVLIVIATIKANQGIPYRYPCTIRFIK